MKCRANTTQSSAARLSFSIHSFCSTLHWKEAIGLRRVEITRLLRFYSLFLFGVFSNWDERFPQGAENSLFFPKAFFPRTLPRRVHSQWHSGFSRRDLNQAKEAEKAGMPHTELWIKMIRCFLSEILYSLFLQCKNEQCNSPSTRFPPQRNWSHCKLAHFPFESDTLTGKNHSTRLPLLLVQFPFRLKKFCYLLKLGSISRSLWSNELSYGMSNPLNWSRTSEKLTRRSGGSAHSFLPTPRFSLSSPPFALCLIFLSICGVIKGNNEALHAWAMSTKTQMASFSTWVKPFARINSKITSRSYFRPTWSLFPFNLSLTCMISSLSGKSSSLLMSFESF